MNFVVYSFWVVTGLAIAVLPELLMYKVWHLIHPTTPLEKILMLGGFWGLGGSICFLFLVIGLLLSFEGLSNLVNSTKRKRRKLCR